MSEGMTAWSILRKLTWQDALVVLGVFAAARVAMLVLRWTAIHLAEKAPPRLRLAILRVIPLARLAIGVAATALIVPVLVEPTFRNVITLVAMAGVALGFALKDYGSSLVAGLAAVLENAYQPGDWIEVYGAYGEVKSIGARTTRIVTLDDTEVIIPHSRLWSVNVFNSSGGNRTLLCVADFYLNPEHDAAAVRSRLEQIAQASPYRRPDSPVVVTVSEKPWGTHYRLKAHVKESREQVLFISELTVRGKAAIRSMGIRFAQAAFAETK